MAKTVLRVRLDGIAFYMNTETSSPGTGHRNRFRLFKTENYGRDKSGKWEGEAFPVRKSVQTMSSIEQ